jgi:hypothetical protein
MPRTFLSPAAPVAAKPRGNPNVALAPAQPARGLDPRGARAVHGNYGAEPRAENPYRLTRLRIGQVDIALDRDQAQLPRMPLACAGTRRC